MKLLSLALLASNYQTKKATTFISSPSLRLCRHPLTRQTTRVCQPYSVESRVKPAIRSPANPSMLFADKDYPFFVWAVINGSHARASPARGATALFSLHADRKFAVVDKVERLLEYEAKLTRCAGRIQAMKPRKNGRLTVQNRLGDSSPITSAEWPREGTIIRNTHWGILKDDLVLKSYGPFNAGFLVMRLKCPDSEQ